MSKPDDERFGALITASTPLLHRRALGLTRNSADAADLVQDTLLKAWRFRDRFEPGTHLEAWLMTILRNTFLSGIRSGVKETPCGLSAFAARQTSPPSQDWAVAVTEVRAALDGLPADQAEAIGFVAAFGGSYEEAAARFGCIRGTIKSRVSRGREALRRRCHADALFAAGAAAS